MQSKEKKPISKGCSINIPAQDKVRERKEKIAGNMGISTDAHAMLSLLIYFYIV